MRRSIVLGDTTRFLSIPGVGKKTAERVVLELKEKMGLEQIVPEGAPDLVARDALVELGYSAVEAERALSRFQTIVTQVDPALARCAGAEFQVVAAAPLVTK